MEIMIIICAMNVIYTQHIFSINRGENVNRFRPMLSYRDILTKYLGCSFVCAGVCGSLRRIIVLPKSPSTLVSEAESISEPATH